MLFLPLNARILNKHRLGHMRVRAGPAVEVVFKLFAELLYERNGRHRGRVAEWAERAAHHVLGEVLDVVDVLGDAAAGVEAGQRLLEPVGALAAGDAPAAAFVLVKLHGPQGELDHAGGLIEHHDAARAKHAAGLADLVEIHADVDLAGQQAGGRRPAGDHGLELFSVGDAAAHFVDHFPEAVAHGQFVNAGAFDVPAQEEEAGAPVAVGAKLGVLGPADAQHVRDGGDGLGVVDDRGAAVEADHGGEGRPDSGDAALAFERLHQGGLFADLISARAGVRDDVEIHAAAEDVL